MNICYSLHIRVGRYALTGVAGCSAVETGSCSTDEKDDPAIHLPHSAVT